MYCAGHSIPAKRAEDTGVVVVDDDAVELLLFLGSRYICVR